jgi:predicted GNAT superfamily acetyltransferase
MTDDVRLLVDLPDLEAAAQVINAVWEDPTLSSPALLRAYTHFGNPTFGAFVDGTLVGVAVAFVAPAGGIHLHSHITGLLPDFRDRGLGHRLKEAQRDWCRRHDIAEITWTFDPMLARNAHFNLRKLGAVAEAVLPAFYGAMDDGVNRGEVTDRLEVHWDVGDEPAPGRGAVTRTVRIPLDYADLRTRDAATAAAERARVREELTAAFDAGLVAVDFDLGRGEYGFAVV